MIRICLLGLPLFLSGCAVKATEVPGDYPIGGSDLALRRLNPDGTFANYANGRRVSGGTWHLMEQPFDQGIEFDSESSADEYRLVRRHGTLCWEIRRDYEYVCKKS